MKNISLENFMKVYNDVINFPTIDDVANELDCSSRTVNYRLKSFIENKECYQIDRRSIRTDKVTTAKSNPWDILSDDKITTAKSNPWDILSDDKKTIYKLNNDITNLKTALNEARLHVHDMDNIKNIINKIEYVGIEKTYSANWIKSEKDSTNSIVPVLCLSDLHIGSVVKPENVNYVNEYNVEIAKFRIFKIVNDFIDIYTNKFDNYTYPGMVLIFGGDMIEQAMHGAEETNDLTVINQVIQTVSILREVIRMLSEHFPKIYIPSVSGNHGRLIADKYVKDANRLEHSLEKLVYHYVAEDFKYNENILLQTSSSDILHFSINGLRFRLEHGDSVSFTGNAIAGPLNSYERARLKKNSVDSAVGKAFDVLIIGHFHSHLVTGKLITMDSPKGYDTYVQRMALPYSSPGVTTFAVNAKGNVIFSTNLVIDGKVNNINKSIELF